MTLSTMFCGQKVRNSSVKESGPAFRTSPLAVAKSFALACLRVQNEVHLETPFPKLSLDNCVSTTPLPLLEVHLKIPDVKGAVFLQASKRSGTLFINVEYTFSKHLLLPHA